MKFETVIHGGKLVYPEKTILADLALADGTIQKIGEPGQLPGKQTLDAGGCYVLPGVVDPHTHPVYLDTISGLSKTAAFGGVTTVIHYAYAKPGQSLIDIIDQYKEEGERTSFIDFALHGGLFETLKQADEIPEAFKRGVTSFKMFVAYAKLGWMTDDYALAKAMDVIGRLRGLAAVHAENGLVIDYIQDRMLAEKADFASRFLETSPDLAEAEAIFRSVTMGKLMNCPVYIPHIASEEGVEVIRYLKQRGMHVYAETCPQYLSLTWDELKSKGPLGKVGPAIKNQTDQDALWSAIREGLFDTLGSDHAPKDKNLDDDFFKAAYGSPEIETMLPVVWHQGVNSGRVTPNDLVRLFSENPAKITGLFPRKGRLEAGSDADIVIFDPSETWSVAHANQHSSAHYTLFEGKTLMGRVKKVLSRGSLIVDGENIHESPGYGQFIPTRAGNWPYIA